MKCNFQGFEMKIFRYFLFKYFDIDHLSIGRVFRTEYFHFIRITENQPGYGTTVVLKEDEWLYDTIKIIKEVDEHYTLEDAKREYPEEFI